MTQYVWQYKNSREGWSNYNKKASKFLESVYAGYKANRGDCDVRAVKSGSWEYQVDFLAMMQTNTQDPSHKIRKIRRHKI